MRTTREEESSNSLKGVLESEGLEEDLTALIQTIAQAAISLAGDIALDVGGTDSSGNGRVRWDSLEQKAVETFTKALMESGLLFAGVSDCQDSLLVPEPRLCGPFVVAFDPMDGLAEMEAGASLGSIFGVFRMPELRARLVGEGLDTPHVCDVLRRPRDQVCAGYVVYGAVTCLVVAFSEKAVKFTLDPMQQEFVLAGPLQLPPRCVTYSVNEANSALWDEPCRRFVAALKTPRAAQRLSLRYTGIVTSDVHRILLQGGVHLSPRDRTSPSGHLKLAYQSGPLAFVAVKAGGGATDGINNILELSPSTLHQRTPLCIGTLREVADLRLLYHTHLAAGSSPAQSPRTAAVPADECPKPNDGMPAWTSFSRPKNLLGILHAWWKVLVLRGNRVESNIKEHLPWVTRFHILSFLFLLANPFSPLTYFVTVPVMCTTTVLLVFCWAVATLPIFFISSLVQLKNLAFQCFGL